MSQPKNILLICGGGGTEHEISLISAQFLMSKLQNIQSIQPFYLSIEKDSSRRNDQGQDCELRKAGELYNRETKETVKLDYIIPCFHGPPGETGQIQAVFELMGLPYLGASSEASINCFNKATTKLWLTNLGIKNSPYVVLNNQNLKDKKSQIEDLFESSNKDVFIKATHQGSSVGCYHATNIKNLYEYIDKALALSPYVLVEKTIEGRELEVAVFEYQGKIHATKPGEIICPATFYSYDEKYANESDTKTITTAEDLSDDLVFEIQDQAIKAFKGLNIKDLARVDFFLTKDNQLLINEINTFPGHTPISMFPTMMEAYGVKYENFLKDRIHTK